MKKKTLFISILTLLSIIFLCGCNEVETKRNEDEEKMIGTWINSEIYNGTTREITYIFYSNNKGEIKISYVGETFMTDCEWKIDNNKLLIDVSEPSESRLINDYTFSNNNNTMALTDSLGNTITYNRI
jgi:hypothetical protein